MKIVKTVDEVREYVKAWRQEGLSVGLVPTMGYLHAGHQSLIAASVADNDRTVVSVFVNPMQFGPTEDLESYPRDINRDAELCESTGADLIFNPEPEEMYKDGFIDVYSLYKYVDTRTMEIKYRLSYRKIYNVYYDVYYDNPFYPYVRYRHRYGPIPVPSRRMSPPPVSHGQGMNPRPSQPRGGGQAPQATPRGNSQTPQQPSRGSQGGSRSR